MKLSKTTEKLNTKLLSCLQKLQEKAAQELGGFVGLSHAVHFDHFPGSLLVDCYFQDETLLQQAKTLEAAYQKTLHQLLLKQGILLKNSRHHLRFCLTT